MACSKAELEVSFSMVDPCVEQQQDEGLLHSLRVTCSLQEQEAQEQEPQEHCM
jgi:hypothetical protein